MHLRWTNWHSIDEASPHRGPATYKIRLVSDGRARAIPRFFGPDAAGILAIGKATNMQSRRRRMGRGAARGRGHSEMNLLAILGQHAAPSAMLSGAQYEVAYCVCETVEDAEYAEQLLLKKYLLTFGELPPLNSAIPGRYVLEGWQQAARIDAGSAF